MVPELFKKAIIPLPVEVPACNFNSELSSPVITTSPSSLSWSFVVPSLWTLNNWLLEPPVCPRISILKPDWLLVASTFKIGAVLCKCKISAGLSVPIPTRPVLVMRSFSLPAVSNEIVLFAGNLILVSVSPWCIIESPR